MYNIGLHKNMHVSTFHRGCDCVTKCMSRLFIWNGGCVSLKNISYFYIIYIKYHLFNCALFLINIICCKQNKNTQTLSMQSSLREKFPHSFHQALRVQPLWIWIS